MSEPVAQVESQSLLINGEVPNLETPPEVLERALILGRTAVFEAMEAYYQKMWAFHKDPAINIKWPPIFVMPIGATKKIEKILTPAGLANNTKQHRRIDEMHERFHPHWLAIEQADFVPEVWSGIGSYSHTIASQIVLLLQAPQGAQEAYQARVH